LRKNNLGFTRSKYSCFVITTKQKNLFKTNTRTKNILILNSNYYNLEKNSLLYRLFWQIGNFYNFNQSKKLIEILKEEKPTLVLTNNLMGIGWKTFKNNKKAKYQTSSHFT
jgi:hypothetical protein